MVDVLVVGSGISGLSTAYRLSKAGVSVLVCEKEEEIGGNIRTRSEGGYLFEEGPQTVLADGEVLGFFKELGLEPVEASPSSKNRYILKKGRLIPVPLNPVSFLTTPLLSFKGKLRVLKEFFIPPEPKEEESLASFVRRRLGEEVLRYLVQPFVSGVYAGDPEELSVRYAFPKLYALEKEGGLIRGAIKRRTLGPGGVLVSFKGGLKDLVEALSSKLEIRKENVVLRIRKKEDRFVIDTRGGKVEARAVVVSSPAYTLSYLLKDLSWSAAKEFEEIDYPPLAVANVGVRGGSVPEGFGFLAPRVEGKRILGVIFSSKIFKGRSPEGRELLTVYIGGATDRGVAEMKEEEILEVVEKELKEILGVQSFDFAKVKVWKRSIPQYKVGYGKFLDLAEEVEREFKGLFLTGNYLGGVSVADCVRRSKVVAEKVIRFLEGS